MADEKILVEIVLDDGSVQRGFAKIQQGANQTSKAVTKDFQTVGDALDSVSVSNFTNQLRNIPVVAGGVVAGFVAVGLALKEAFDLALTGERLAVIDAQFQRLTQNAGVSADALRADFARAADGLVDLDDVLLRANEALINLGASAQRLPELLDLSRRVTQTLGGDIQERFDAIVRAVETGNARLLRQQGIIIDADQALRAYAQSLGVATNELTLAQRQQAILNGVIEQGNAQYNAINTSIQPLTDNSSRLRVALGELGDAIAIITRQTLGEFFSGVAGGAAIATNKVAELLNSLAQPKTGIELIRELDQVNERLRVVQNQVDTLGRFADLPLKGELVALKERAKELQDQLTQTNKEVLKLSQPAEQIEIGLTEQQLAAQQQRQSQINQLFQQGSQFRIQLLQLELQQTQDLEQQKLLNQQITDEQIRIAAETLNNDLLAIDQKYSSDLGFTEEQRDQARLARAIAFNNQLQLINTQSAQRQVAQQTALSNQLRTITLTGLTQTLQGIGAALARGENLFAAFGQGLVGIFGDILITVGNALIIQGIALEKFITAINTLLPGSGLAAAAAGVGLVIFGSALKAAVGSRGTGLTATPTPVVPTSPVGETAPVPTSPTELTPVSETQRAVDTQVVVNIQGDVLDSDETGSRIISLINEAFDKKGVQVRRGVTA